MAIGLAGGKNIFVEGLFEKNPELDPVFNLGARTGVTLRLGRDLKSFWVLQGDFFRELSGVSADLGLLHSLSGDFWSVAAGISRKEKILLGEAPVLPVPGHWFFSTGLQVRLWKIFSLSLGAWNILANQPMGAGLFLDLALRPFSGAEFFLETGLREGQFVLSGGWEQKIAFFFVRVSCQADPFFVSGQIRIPLGNFYLEYRVRSSPNLGIYHRVLGGVSVKSPERTLK